MYLHLRTPRINALVWSELAMKMHWYQESKINITVFIVVQILNKAYFEFDLLEINKSVIIIERK